MVEAQCEPGPLTPTFSATDTNLATQSATLDGVSFTSGTPVTAEGPHTLLVTPTDHPGKLRRVGSAVSTCEGQATNSSVKIDRPVEVDYDETSVITSLSLHADSVGVYDGGAVGTLGSGWQAESDTPTPVEGPQWESHLFREELVCQGVEQRQSAR